VSTEEIGEVGATFARKVGAGIVLASELVPFLLMALFCVGMWKLEMKHVWVFMSAFLDWEEGVTI